MSNFAAETDNRATVRDKLTVPDTETLGMTGVPAGARVVVAMSGGVDSSVVAALLAHAGFEVVGVTLQLYDHGRSVKRAGACCAGDDIKDARRIASHLGIAHYVLDFEERFRAAVIEPFAESYVRGETPVPCVTCNETVKFADLSKVARDLGAAALVTGHYVDRREGADGPELHAGADPARDQSYFLATLTREQLGFARFPLARLRKSETRALAERFGLQVAAKADSQDICFVPEGRYGDLVRRLRPQASLAGDIVTQTGEVVGRHDGLIDFTVGQRRGLGISGPEPRHVLRLDPVRRHVVVGPRAALLQGEAVIRDLSWLVGEPPSPQGEPVRVRVRSTRPPVPARLIPGPGGLARLAFEQPEEAVAPGQIAALYEPVLEGSRVLGGGRLAAAAN